MTALLASVTNIDEARLVSQSGVNIIDLKNPLKGALGALTDTEICGIVSELNGVTTVSATIGDLPFKKAEIRKPVLQMQKSGVDIIKIGVFGDVNNRETLSFLSQLASRGSRFVLVFFAEDLPDVIDFASLKAGGIHGVMIDTRNKQDGNLRAKITIESLREFCSRARENDLLCGLAGSIGVSDIPALLALQPDYLGFRGALCRGGARTGQLSEQALQRIRQMIPQDFDKSDLIIANQANDL